MRSKRGTSGDNDGHSRGWRPRRSSGSPSGHVAAGVAAMSRRGRKGVQDRRIGRASARAVPVDDALRMVTRYETQSTGGTVTHFHERGQVEHGGQRSYSWTKKALPAAGHVVRAPRRGAPRKKRSRTPLPGMLRHQDGSTPEGGARLPRGCDCDPG
jgi:hypothetical protein